MLENVLLIRVQYQHCHRNWPMEMAEAMCTGCHGIINCTAVQYIILLRCGLAGCLEVCTLAFVLLTPSLDLEPGINGHPGVSHAGRSINVFAVHQKDIKLDDPSARPAPVDSTH